MNAARHRTLAAIRACDPSPPHEAAYPEYFVVMVELGHRGREAIVDPEMTRAAVVERLRNRAYGEISFIHRIHGDECHVVTNELLNEAGVNDEMNPPEIDRQAARFDHDRKLRVEA